MSKKLLLFALVFLLFVSFSVNVFASSSGDSSIKNYDFDLYWTQPASFELPWKVWFSYSVSALDGSRFVVAYTNLSTPCHASVRIGDFDGMNIHLGKEIFVASGGDISVSALDGSRFVVAYNTVVGSSSVASVRVGSVSSSGIFSWLSNEKNISDPSMGVQGLSVSALDGSRFVVAYANSSSDAHIFLKVCSINDNVVHCGSPFTIDAGHPTNYLQYSVSSLDGSRFVVAVSVPTLSDFSKHVSYLYFFNSDDNDDITYSHFTMTLSSNSDYTHSVNIAKLGSSHFVVAYHDETLKEDVVRVGHFNGSDVVWDTAPSVFNRANDSIISVSSLDDSHFVVVYNSEKEEYKGSARVGHFNGSDVVWDTAPSAFSSLSGWFNSVSSLDDSHFVVNYEIPASSDSIYDLVRIGHLCVGYGGSLGEGQSCCFGLVGVSGRCVCPSDRPVWNGSVCVECTASNTSYCSSLGSGYVCNVSSSTCVVSYPLNSLAISLLNFSRKFWRGDDFSLFCGNLSEVLPLWRGGGFGCVLRGSRGVVSGFVLDGESVSLSSVLGGFGFDSGLCDNVLRSHGSVSGWFACDGGDAPPRVWLDPGDGLLVVSRGGVDFGGVGFFSDPFWVLVGFLRGLFVRDSSVVVLPDGVDGFYFSRVGGRRVLGYRGSEDFSVEFAGFCSNFSELVLPRGVGVSVLDDAGRHDFIVNINKGSSAFGSWSLLTGGLRLSGESGCECRRLDESSVCSRRCGSVWDGCGGFYDCGGCGSGEVCSSYHCCPSDRPVWNGSECVVSHGSCVGYGGSLGEGQSCCSGLEVSNGHCCQVGEIWNVSLKRCVSPFGPVASNLLFEDNQYSGVSVDCKKGTYTYHMHSCRGDPNLAKDSDWNTAYSISYQPVSYKSSCPYIVDHTLFHIQYPVPSGTNGAILTYKIGSDFDSVEIPNFCFESLNYLDILINFNSYDNNEVCSPRTGACVGDCDQVPYDIHCVAKNGTSYLLASGSHWGDMSFYESGVWWNLSSNERGSSCGLEGESCCDGFVCAPADFVGENLSCVRGMCLPVNLPDNSCINDSDCPEGEICDHNQCVVDRGNHPPRPPYEPNEETGDSSSDTSLGSQDSGSSDTGSSGGGTLCILSVGGCSGNENPGTATS